MNKNIVHQYFKKEVDGTKVLAQINPIHFTGVQINITSDGKMEAIEMESGEDIIDLLVANGFKESSALEFNLHFSGLIN
jgi:hypothetical protein